MMLVSKGMVTSWLCQLALFTAHAQGDNCYSYRGSLKTNQVKCNGSQACCGSGAECMPNRLCKNKGTADNILIRGPCGVSPYDKTLCAQICVFNEIQANTGFDDDMFPRVEICGDGVYCCRMGETPCCTNHTAEKFSLDSNGILLPESSTTSSTTSSSATSSSTSSSLTTFTGSTSTPVSSTTPIVSTPSQGTTPRGSGSESRSDETLALKVGLGVSIPSAAIIAALAMWCFLKKKQGNNEQNVELFAAKPEETVSSGPNQASEMHEMTGRPAEGGWTRSAQELGGTEVYEPQTRERSW